MAEVKRAAVIGTGTMGPGMGAVLERAGIDVALYDVSEEALERAKKMAEMARGVLERLGGEATDGGALRFETDLAAALEGADVVLEAIPEKLELKQEALAEWEGMIADDAVIASNTSGIPITKMAEKLAHPERVIGMHWSNPPQLIPMIEVIPGERTSEETIATARELIERIGYYPCLLKKEVPGFVENRVLYAIMRECLALVDEGVIDAEQLDLNVKWGIGYKLAVIPPMQLLDVAGLDIYESVAGYLNSDLSTEGGVSETVTKLTGEGKLGIKTGGGLFDYSEDELAELPAKRAAALVAVRKTLDGQDV
jgi:3-hydroxyacyl-CoA dehydrogenase